MEDATLLDEPVHYYKEVNMGTNDLHNDKA